MSKMLMEKLAKEKKSKKPIIGGALLGMSLASKVMRPITTSLHRKSYNLNNQKFNELAAGNPKILAQKAIVDKSYDDEYYEQFNGIDESEVDNFEYAKEVAGIKRFNPNNKNHVSKMISVYKSELNGDDKRRGGLPSVDYMTKIQQQLDYDNKVDKAYDAVRAFERKHGLDAPNKYDKIRLGIGAATKTIGAAAGAYGGYRLRKWFDENGDKNFAQLKAEFKDKRK